MSHARAKTGMLLASLLLPWLAVAPAHAQDQDSSLQDYRLVGTFGLNYSNGGYGTDQNTNVLLDLSSLSVETGDFKFTASMPYMRISGRGLVVFDAAGNAIVINRRGAQPSDVRTGWGDLNLSATYAIPDAVLDGFEVKLTGIAKVPTAADHRRLSTGEADYGASIDVSRRFGDWVPFLTVGYLIPGQPATFRLFDTASVSAGTSLEISDNLVAVASYDYDSSSAPQTAASHQLFGSLSWIRDDRITLTGYTMMGLSDGSPNIGGGLLVSFGFN
jgi:hypothetical protein